MVITSDGLESTGSVQGTIIVWKVTTWREADAMISITDIKWWRAQDHCLLVTDNQALLFLAWASVYCPEVLIEVGVFKQDPLSLKLYSVIFQGIGLLEHLPTVSLVHLSLKKSGTYFGAHKLCKEQQCSLVNLSSSRNIKIWSPFP